MCLSRVCFSYDYHEDNAEVYSVLSMNLLKLEKVSGHTTLCPVRWVKKNHGNVM